MAAKNHSHNGYKSFEQYIANQIKAKGGDWTWDSIKKTVGELWALASREEKDAWKAQAAEQAARDAYRDALPHINRPARRPQRPKPKKKAKPPKEWATARLIREQEADRRQVLYFDSDYDHWKDKRVGDKRDVRLGLYVTVVGQTPQQWVRDKEFKMVVMQPYYMDTEGRDAPPAEVAMLSFSLKRGIIEERWWMLRAPEIPSHVNELVEKCVDSHEISPVMGDGVEQWYEDEVLVLKAIKKHLGEHDRLFTTESQYDEGVFGIFSLQDYCGEHCGGKAIELLVCLEDLGHVLLDDFRVVDVTGKYDLREQQSRAVEKCVRRMKPRVVGAEVAARLKCPFHRERQPASECALSMAKLALYGLYKALEVPLGLQLAHRGFDPTSAVPAPQSNVVPAQSYAEALKLQAMQLRQQAAAADAPSDDGSSSSLAVSRSPAQSVKSEHVGALEQPPPPPPSVVRHGAGIGRGMRVACPPDRSL